MLHLSVITIIPEIFNSLNYGIIGQSIKKKLIKINFWNPRDYTKNSKRRIDDRPYGGGPGMVIMYEPIYQAITQAKKNMPAPYKSIYLTSHGKKITQSYLLKNIINNNQSLIFISGRYKGIDERIIIKHVNEEWSIGDFIISGGEFAAMVFIDAIVRLIPGTLNNKDSITQDSFSNGLLDYPHYTRPMKIDNLNVPSVLLSGNHLKIKKWRKEKSLKNTFSKRPDLLEHKLK
ncbi:tRNA (guanosine(37)-N1)-methyltransferase TrmD [Candidatus Legionella polyplacis]|uniref:tRNA (guanine-N(1)-)-methyltransferase n=1 Tax=Candidatus Legionella polyplacis TaxID=2005262 RepID=A0ABZ2GZS6_9GAMM